MLDKRTKNEFARAFPKRKTGSHKGDYGKVLLICGSKGMTGAACLAAQAAVRCGAGLVTVAIPDSLNTIVAIKLTEAMTLPIDDDRKGFLLRENLDEVKRGIAGKDVVGIGPGLGHQESTKQFVRALYPSIEQPLILDADGLNAFINDRELMRLRKGNTIITPHEGEFRKLFGDITPSREEAAGSVARDYNMIVVLKGSRTVVADSGGEIFVNMTGNPGMATGGTGDCLFGMIAAFVGLGLPLFQAAKFAVFMHGLSGDIARDTYGEVSMTASDLLDSIPHAFLRLSK
ncbi:MAG: NAD(P)H-hydrate dehydratase [Candidatus Omnitrophica bacterium]|nr:NAD(P)H-hydrate dehydratase [Candidatus Omnitrophota bacterium]